RLAAAMLGTLIKGLGPDHVIWGTDSIWTGSPPWQVEALRRVRVPGGQPKGPRLPPPRPARGPRQNRHPPRTRPPHLSPGERAPRGARAPAHARTRGGGGGGPAPPPRR